mgnify:CR=1 FL=1
MRIQLNDPGLGKHDPGNGVEHARVVPVLEDFGLDSYVPNGSVIDVPDEVAGAAPHWRLATPGDDVAFMESRTDAKGKVTVHDLGHGLLAQVDIWSKADAPATKNQEG